MVNNPPPSIANNPPPLPKRVVAQEKTYPDDHSEHSETPQVRTYPENNKKTHLIPISYQPEATAGVPKADDALESEKNKSEIPNNDLSPVDQPVKSVSDLTITLAPVVSVCAIFLVVGIIALVFRKKICLGRTKSNKDEMVSYFTLYFIFIMHSTRTKRTIL